MGIFAQRMAELDIEVSSPDGGIQARLAAGDRVEVWFTNGCYEQYTEPALERQLVSLARLLLVARTRARRNALGQALGDGYWPDRGPLDDPRQRRFREKQAELIAVGRSQWIEITATPSGFWSVRIEPGTLSRLSEPHFLSEIHTAITQGMIDVRQQLFKLREEIYGQQLPDPRHRGGRRWR